MQHPPGADPKIGTVPVPALILAILSRDVEAVSMLLQAGADPTATLWIKYGYKSPLHVAAGLPGEGESNKIKFSFNNNLFVNLLFT